MFHKSESLLQWQRSNTEYCQMILKNACLERRTCEVLKEKRQKSITLALYDVTGRMGVERPIFEYLMAEALQNDIHKFVIDGATFSDTEIGKALYDATMYRYTQFRFFHERLIYGELESYSTDYVEEPVLCEPAFEQILTELWDSLSQPQLTALRQSAAIIMAAILVGVVVYVKLDENNTFLPTQSEDGTNRYEVHFQPNQSSETVYLRDIFSVLRNKKSMQLVLEKDGDYVLMNQSLVSFVCQSMSKILNPQKKGGSHSYETVFTRNNR